MGRRGPGALPQAEKREQFARLIAQGFSNPEACRIVGINRRTGKRWRHGRTITTGDGRKRRYAAVVGAGAVRQEISPRYLSEDERVRIADLRRAGAGVRAMAEQTGRSPSTISRELRRNRDPGSGQYLPFTAAQRPASGGRGGCALLAATRAPGHEPRDDDDGHRDQSDDDKRLERGHDPARGRDGKPYGEDRAEDCHDDTAHVPGMPPGLRRR